MINFTLRIKVQAHRRMEFLDAARMIIEPMLVLPGCKSCRISQDLNDIDIAILVEEWQSKEDFERHIRSDEFRIILSMMELSSEKPEVEIATIANIEGFEAIERIRNQRKEN